MEPDRYEISPKGEDLAFVTAYVDDEDHAIVPRTKNEIQFEVKGPAKIVATDNGDATDLTQFSSHKRKAFNGRCLVILRATGPGEIILHATSPGLRDSSLKIEAK
jgi:beta-galactosidase